MKKLLVLVIILASVNVMFSQKDSLNWRFGVFGNLNFNIHSADFQRIPDCPSCSPGYESGFGFAPHLGILFEYPVAEKFMLYARGSYFDYSGELSRTEDVTVIVEGQDQPGAFEHNFDAGLTSINFEPGISYNIMPGLFAGMGFSAGSNLSATYDQEEKIVKPEDTGTFLNPDGTDSESRTRNEFSGDMQDANPLNLALSGHITYELPLNLRGNFILAPEIRFYYGLSQINEAESVSGWNYATVAGGIAIKYSPVEQEIIREYEKKYEIDTLIIEGEIITKKNYRKGKEHIETYKERQGDIEFTTEIVTRTDTLFRLKTYDIACDIIAVGVDENGIEHDKISLKIEEFTLNKVMPLLPYVFFEENSSDISPGYNLVPAEETGEFDYKNMLDRSALETYYDILNIIGYRLRNNPGTQVTLTGCNAALGGEMNNLELSGKRAENVKDYFEDVWGIAPERMKIEARNLPEEPSLPKDEPDKTEENRRVEIYSESYEIMKPVFINDTLRKANPPVVRFKPDISAGAGVRDYRITAYQTEDRILFDPFFKDKAKEAIDWQITADPKRTVKRDMPLKYKLYVSDNKNNKCISEERELPVEYIKLKMKREQNMADMEYNKFNLILFEFDKAELEGTNVKIIEYIKSQIEDNSDIVISGYTDRTGDSYYNKKLSKRRADAVQNALNRPDAKVQGIGEDDLLYENESPEGRFYSRTVEIEVATPVR